MITFAKARRFLEQLFRPEDDESPPARGNIANDEEESSPDQRLQQFMDELRDNSQEWLGRVRRIGADSIRERLGSRWANLQDRVEILAEKIIQEEVSPQDRYVHAGDAEFLVFFADATPEESRIRCLAIVETIHEKLFGAEDYLEASQQRVVECHVVHKDDLILEWESAASDDSVGSQGPSIKVIQNAFRYHPEVLDRVDIALSTQAAVDSIISRGSECKDAAELPSLLMRLRYLSRSLKVLEPALMASAKAGADGKQHGEHGRDHPTSEHGGGKEQSGVMPFGTAEEDIAEAIFALDAGSDHSNGDPLEALRKLQRTRLERAAFASATDSCAREDDRKKHESDQFTYIPIYRSLSQGRRIHQGLYRVSCSRPPTGLIAEKDEEIAPHLPQAALERATLEHAIQYLLDYRATSGFVLMVSVDVETLRGPNTQRQFSTVLRSAQLRAKRRLLIEVIDYSPTDHTIAMRRAIEELRLHCHAVFVTLSHKCVADLERAATECKMLGAHAIGLDASRFGKYENMTGILTHFASAASEHSVLTYLGGIDSVAVLAKAITSGINYISAPAFRPGLQIPDDAKCVTFDDLYSAI